MKVPTELWKDLEQAPKTRDYIFPACQELHRVTECSLPVSWPSMAFPSGTEELLTCHAVFHSKARDFKGQLFCKVREHMELPTEHTGLPRDDVSADLQLILMYWLFPMVVYLCLCKV